MQFIHITEIIKLEYKKRYVVELNVSLSLCQSLNIFC